MNIRNCLGVVIELISSNWKVISTCADLYITEIFFSCKCVFNELTRARHNCQLSHTHQYTRGQEVKKKKKSFKLLSHACSHASLTNINYFNFKKCRNTGFYTKLIVWGSLGLNFEYDGGPIIEIGGPIFLYKLPEDRKKQSLIRLFSN